MSVHRTASILCLLACNILPAQEMGTREGLPPGHRLWQGDIIVPEGTDSVFQGTPWPNGQVPYTFHSNVDLWQRRLATLMFQEWEAVANLDFFPRTTQPDYIRVRGSTGNSSSLGIAGGLQNLNLYNWNRRGTPYHEVGHALTLLHEQTRPDRDAYVAIQWNNIDPAYWSQYDIQPGAGTVGSYDFLSVMHYPDWGFSINGQPTMLALPPYAAFQPLIGQRHGLTDLDAAGAAFIYGPPAPPAITSVTPSTVDAGAGTQRLVLQGERFFTKSRVRWNGQLVPTRYAGPDRLLVELSPAVVSPFVGLLAVENPAPGGGLGAPVSVPVMAGPSGGPLPAAATWSLGWGCRGFNSGPRLEVSAAPALGTTVSLSASFTSSNGSGWLVASPPAPTTLDVEHWGCEVQVDPTSMFVLTTLSADANGAWSQSFAIPQDPALAGVEYDLQVAVVDPGSSIGVLLTNGLRVRFGM